MDSSHAEVVNSVQYKHGALTAVHQYPLKEIKSKVPFSRDVRQPNDEETVLQFLAFLQQKPKLDKKTAFVEGQEKSIQLLDEALKKGIQSQVLANLIIGICVMATLQDSSVKKALKVFDVAVDIKELNMRQKLTIGVLQRCFEQRITSCLMIDCLKQLTEQQLTLLFEAMFVSMCLGTEFKTVEPWIDTLTELSYKSQIHLSNNLLKILSKIEAKVDEQIRCEQVLTETEGELEFLTQNYQIIMAAQKATQAKNGLSTTEVFYY